MIVAIYIFLILIFSIILIKAAEFLVVSLKRLARHSKASVFGLSAVLLALSTSFPELFVAITSALEESSALSLGNVIGANIANISLVTALAILISRKDILIYGDYLKRDVGLALVAGVLPLFLALDYEISRVDGLILIFVYASYATSYFKRRYSEIGQEHEQDLVHRFWHTIQNVNFNKTKELGRLFTGTALLLFAASMIVRFAQDLADVANIPVFLVGVLVLSVGTTLPELAFSVRSLNDHEPKMFFGNVLGSIIANSTLVIGTATVISPIKIQAFSDYSIASIAFIVLFGTFWLFIKSKHRLDKWEGIVLLALYIAFIGMEIYF